MTKEEFEKRFHENEKITGFGPFEVTMHIPCPFCAAPDFIITKVLEVEKSSCAGATCKECGRGCKAIYTHDGPSPSTSFEFVQTGGEDPPPFLPFMRRVP